MLFTLQLRDQSTCGLKDAGGGSAIDSATNFANELAEHKSSCWGKLWSGAKSRYKFHQKLSQFPMSFVLHWQDPQHIRVGAQNWQFAGTSELQIAIARIPTIHNGKGVSWTVFFIYPHNFFVLRFHRRSALTPHRHASLKIHPEQHGWLTRRKFLLHMGVCTHRKPMPIL